MESFDRRKIRFSPLSERESKSSIEKIAINPDANYFSKEKDNSKIIKIANEILKAKENGKPVIIAFGAHLIKNGLCLVIRRMIEEGFVSHLATNGAGSIHDWEFAYQGKSEEDVEKYVNQGKFGIWEETGKYINLALIEGAKENKGYGEAVGEMIHKDLFLNHAFKRYSVQESAFVNNIPFTIHPGFGYDIIYSHYLSDGASIGKCAEIDFLRFVESVFNLEGGVFISIGSAIMSPMIFEKSLSMARNSAFQEGKEIRDFMIVINDIKEGWDFSKGEEPSKNHPAYYDRLCKSFKRMGSREMLYVKADNKEFLTSLYGRLKASEKFK